MTPKLLLIDNYDSFTYNLVQAFLILGAHVEVFRNDEITVDAALAMDLSHLCISPGPGRPDDAGISLAMIGAFAELVPVLGVCLGHQSIVQFCGGNIVSASKLMHGKTSMVEHDGRGMFAGLNNPMEAGRYHSLAAERDEIPDVLEITARTADGEVMGVRHRELPMEGVQFHPESVLTPDGDQLLHNFLQLRTA